MEVLLLEDIAGVGQKDDLLVVGDGYALNFLLPQSKAMIATPTVRRRYAERIRRRAEEREMERASAQTKAQQVSGQEVSFQRKVTKTGKLYAAITESHIVEAVKDQLKIDVEEAAISIPEPIKATGDFEVSLKLNEAETPLTVKVTAEEAK